MNVPRACTTICRAALGATALLFATACALLFNGDPIKGAHIDMNWPPLDSATRKAKIADAQQARQIHQPLLFQLDQALKDRSPGLLAKRLLRERDVCELTQLTLDLACCRFEGQYLGWHYVGSGAKEDGLRATDPLAKGGVLADKIIAWTGHDPEEQKSYLPGWKSCRESYSKVFTDLEKRVREKLSQER